MRKVIRPGGAMEMVREEHDDIIATLEQENRQLRARNERLEKENNCLSVEQISAMWRHSDGKPMVFARMVESFHGIGEVVKNV